MALFLGMNSLSSNSCSFYAGASSYWTIFEILGDWGLGLTSILESKDLMLLKSMAG